MLANVHRMHAVIYERRKYYTNKPIIIHASQRFIYFVILYSIQNIVFFCYKVHAKAMLTMLLIVKKRERP